MSNIVAGAIGILLAAVFLLFLAYKIGSVPFWIVILGGLALMLHDLVGEARAARS